MLEFSFDIGESFNKFLEKELITNNEYFKKIFYNSHIEFLYFLDDHFFKHNSKNVFNQLFYNLLLF